METMKEKSTAAAITVRQSSSHSGSAGRGGREGRRSGRAPVPTAGGLPWQPEPPASAAGARMRGQQRRPHGTRRLAGTVPYVFSTETVVTLLQKGQEAQGV